MGFYRFCIFFFLYSFLGWVVEVIYAAVTRGVFVNRGFLNGPVCPIYGVGMTAVIAILAPFRRRLLVLIPFSILFTTLLELVTGFLMEKIFHHRWWDYSKEPFNLGGYVCLKFSLLWGFACVFVVALVHPLAERMAELLPLPAGIALLLIFTALFLCDLVLTLTRLIRLERDLKRLAEMGTLLHSFSDKLGQGLAKSTLRLVKAGEKVKEGIEGRAETSREKWEELKKRREALEERTEKESRRFLKAFPQLRSIRYREELERIRERLTRKKSPRTAAAAERFEKTGTCKGTESAGAFALTDAANSMESADSARPVSPTLESDAADVLSSEKKSVLPDEDENAESKEGSREPDKDGRESGLRREE